MLVRLSSAFVIPGLDPGIHSVTVADGFWPTGMDPRVRPEDDEAEMASFHSAPSPLAPHPHLLPARGEKGARALVPFHSRGIAEPSPSS